MHKPDDILLGKYRLIRLLGRGGMGEVFLAEHISLGMQVAIKLLRHDRAIDDEALARLQREAIAAAAVGHPGVIDVHDVGVSEGGAPFLVMEALEGRSLRQHLDRVETVDQETTAFIACQVLSALEATHRSGIVHRDLKPDNIFLVETGRQTFDIKLLDFGISKTDDPSLERSESSASGAIRGTPCYMSPEQARGKPSTDHRTDLYSVGAIAFECLAGEPPITGRNYNNVIIKLFSEPVRPPSELGAKVDASLERVILKALSKDPEERHGSAQELLNELIPYVSDQQTSQLFLSALDPDATPLPTLAATTQVTPRGLRSSFLVMVGIFACGGVAAWLMGLGPEPVGQINGDYRTSAMETAVVDSSAPSAEALAEVELLVNLTPRTARLFVDDMLVLGNPFSGRFPQDERAHLLRAEADGYETMNMVVVFDQDQELTLELTSVARRTQPEPRLRRSSSKAPGVPVVPRDLANDDDEDPWLGQ